MKQKFQVGDIVRVKHGVYKDQLAEVMKVFRDRFNYRYKYIVSLRNSRSRLAGWSFDFDKALAPITTKDLKRYGLVPEYERNIGSIKVQQFQYQPNTSKKSKITGYLDVSLYTKRNKQNEIIETGCSIWFNHHICADQSCDGELIKYSQLCFNIYSTQDLKKVMDFIQNI